MNKATHLCHLYVTVTNASVPSSVNCALPARPAAGSNLHRVSTSHTLTGFVKKEHTQHSRECPEFVSHPPITVAIEATWSGVTRRKNKETMLHRPLPLPRKRGCVKNSAASLHVRGNVGFGVFGVVAGLRLVFRLGACRLPDVGMCVPCSLWCVGVCP